jgi:hypothetical protein
MTGILSSTFGTFVPTAPTGIVVTEMAKTQSVTAGTDNLNSGAISMTAGRIYLVLLSWDPTANQLPTVTLSDTANTYTQLDNIWSIPATTVAATGVLTQIFSTTAGATATRTITATFSASITAKTMIVLELTNATLTQRSTRAQGRSNSNSISYTGPATVASTDLVLTMVGLESRGTMITSGSTSTSGGTWSAVSSITANPGSDLTSVTTAYQYKILTAAGAQSIAWTLASGRRWASLTFVLEQA